MEKMMIKGGKSVEEKVGTYILKLCIFAESTMKILDLDMPSKGTLLHICLEIGFQRITFVQSQLVKYTWWKKSVKYPKKKKEIIKKHCKKEEFL